MGIEGDHVHRARAGDGRGPGSERPCDVLFGSRVADQLVTG